MFGLNRAKLGIIIKILPIIAGLLKISMPPIQGPLIVMKSIGEVREIHSGSEIPTISA